MNDTVWVVFRSSKLWGTELLRVYADHPKAREYMEALKKESPYFNYIICPKKLHY